MNTSAFIRKITTKTKEAEFECDLKEIIGTACIRHIVKKDTDDNKLHQGELIQFFT